MVKAKKEIKEFNIDVSVHGSPFRGSGFRVSSASTARADARSRPGVRSLKLEIGN